MITVGLIKEANYISRALGRTILLSLEARGALTINIEIENDILSIRESQELIWKESLDEQIGNFGVESCQHIFEILKRKANGDPYSKLIFLENP